ncbi:MAG TPA: endonuclease/exonuclease/phosphatase family protein [Mycobacteriales bacterium]|nr:endonuclease/exonuclease/phosphatase family protein [Mycobacteriales bacterium]
MTLRVLTYNVRSLRDSRAAVAAVIRRCAPDVVCVQEAPRFARWRAARAALARESGLVVATTDRVGGLCLLTSIRVRVQHPRWARLTRTPGQHQRVLCLAELSAGGESYTVGSVHLGGRQAERLRHVEELFGLIGAPAAPLVLAGDVNEEPDGPAWRLLTERLVDAAVAVGSAEPTSTAAAPRRRIDAVFVDPGLEVVACQVPELPGLAGASDHRPVLAVLRRRDQ